MSVLEGQPDDERLGVWDGVVEKLVRAVGVTLVVEERDTLCVPEPQKVPLADALGVEEREGAIVEEPVRELVTVVEVLRLELELGVMVPVLHAVGEPDWVEEGLTETDGL